MLRAPWLVTLTAAAVLPLFAQAAAEQQFRREEGTLTGSTLADGLLVFSREGDTLKVTGSDGQTARLTHEEQVVENGVVQPVDGLLVPAEAGEA